MDDQTKQAFTSAGDWAKQILTLSTGIVTLTVAFADKIFGDLSDGERWTLWISWGLYVGSIVGGVCLLSTLTGTLSRTANVQASHVYAANNRLFAGMQLVFFVLATVAIVIFGFMAAGNENESDPEAAPTIVRLL